MKPEFDKASGDLLANDPPVTLAKVKGYLKPSNRKG